MRKTLITSLVISSIVPSVWAVGVTTYNTPDITAIFGSGNPNTGWAVNTAGDIQLGLRAKGRNDSLYAGLTPNDGAGTYSFADNTGARGAFNYEFSINSDLTGGTDPLTTYQFFLAVDRDPSAGISYSTIDPIFSFPNWTDNSYGNNGTANGAGVEPTDAATYLSLPTVNNIAQNSQNITFSGYPGGALGLEANATYTFNLFAVAAGGLATDTRLADISIDVVIGSGGAAAAVPDGGSTLVLLGAGMAGLAGFRFCKRARKI